VADHTALNPPTKYDSQKLGKLDFSFAQFDIQPDDPRYNHPFFRLVEALWPGDWREQLGNMNDYIRQHERNIKAATESEWWTFIGILIFAAKVKRGGIKNLFDKEKKLIVQLPRIDFSKAKKGPDGYEAKMTNKRFQDLKKVFPIAFHGDDEADERNAIKSLIDGLNNNRARSLAASFCKVYDESMSAWRPRKTKTGGLPFLSYILRKPKPIGTEFKVVACTETGECFELYFINRSNNN
jgi:hypothetical protein